MEDELMNQDELREDFRIFKEDLDSNMTICEALECPFGDYEGGTGKTYGCQRYSSPSQCKLFQVKNTQHNQYFIYPVDKGALCIAAMEVMQLAIDNTDKP